MKKIKPLILAILLAGCATNAPMAGPQNLKFNDQNIYQGQSNDSVEKALGSPDIVSQGFGVKNWWAGGSWYTPGEKTIEWVYLGEKESLIIWLDAGMIARICKVPTEDIKR